MAMLCLLPDVTTPHYELLCLLACVAHFLARPLAHPHLTPSWPLVVVAMPSSSSPCLLIAYPPACLPVKASSSYSEQARRPTPTRLHGLLWFRVWSDLRSCVCVCIEVCDFLVLGNTNKEERARARSIRSLLTITITIISTSTSPSSPAHDVQRDDPFH